MRYKINGTGGTTKKFRNTLDYQDITDFLFYSRFDFGVFWFNVL